MAKLITTSERLDKARDLIDQAKNFPIPPATGWQDFGYVAKVKDLLRQAKELIKLIPVTASATPDQIQDARKLLNRFPEIENEILHRSRID